MNDSTHTRMARELHHIMLCIFFIATFFGRATSQLFFTKTSKVSSTYGVGVTLQFFTNFSSYPGYSFKSIYVDIALGETIAAGGESAFNRGQTNHFGNRLTAYTFPDKTTKLQVFNLLVSNLNFDDNLMLTGNLIYTSASSTAVKHASTNLELEVLGGPMACGLNLLPKTNITVGSTNILTTGLCGKPSPKATWKFHNATYNTTSMLPIAGSKSKYNFTFTIPNVTPSMCGSNVTFVATGHHSGIVVKGITFLNVIFKPVVKFNLNYRVNSSCIHLSWNKTDIGTCTGLVYHIQYLNSTGSPILTTQHQHPHSNYTYCSPTANITGIKDTRIRAAFNGVVGDWGEKVVSLVAPSKPPTVSVAQQTSNSRDEWLTGAIVGGVVGGIVFIVLIVLLFYCCCCAACLICCGCKDKKEKQVDHTTQSLGFQYKKNSKKPKPKSEVIVVEKPPPPRDPSPNPAVIYANSTKLKKEPEFYDPTEFGLDDDETTNTIRSNYNNTTYVDDEDDDDFANKPSVLI